MNILNIDINNFTLNHGLVIINERKISITKTIFNNIKPNQRMAFIGKDITSNFKCQFHNIMFLENYNDSKILSFIRIDIDYFFFSHILLDDNMIHEIIKIIESGYPVSLINCQFDKTKFNNIEPEYVYDFNKLILSNNLKLF